MGFLFELYRNIVLRYESKAMLNIINMRRNSVSQIDILIEPYLQYFVSSKINIYCRMVLLQKGLNFFRTIIFNLYNVFS